MRNPSRPHNVAAFLAAYEPALRKAVTERPDEYAYKIERVPEVVGRMAEAFRTGSYNHDSPAIRAAARELGIVPRGGRFTRKALEAYFEGAHPAAGFAEAAAPEPRGA